jgi:hypothetical protein
MLAATDKIFYINAFRMAIHVWYVKDTYGSMENLFLY